MTTAVEREIELGRVIVTELSRVSGTAAIGIVDKQRSGFVKHRLIHDLSRPEGDSTNARASFESRVFPTVRSAMKLMRPNHFMAKVDISEYYRNFPMAFHHWSDLAFKWKIFGQDFESVLCETCMPFGMSPAPGIGDRFTCATVRYMKSKGFTVVGYLDDFILFGNTEAECLEAYEHLIWFLRDLGFPVNEEKCEPPTRNILFLGIELATNAPGGVCTAGVDAGRVDHILQSIASILQTPSVSAKKVESVLGLLTFVSQVIWGSRLFLRHAYSSLRAVQSRKGVRGFISLSKEAVCDLKWWSRVVTAQGTRKMIVGIAFPVASVLWTTDASTGWGLGAFFQGSHLAVSWDEIRGMQKHPVFPFRCVASSHINYLELFAVYWSLRAWGHLMTGLCMPLYTDSMVVKGMLAKFSGEPVFIPLLKEIYVMLLRKDIRIRPFYINTKDNTLADCASRGAVADEEFQVALSAWKASSVVSIDRDDWQFSPVEVSGLDLEFGPYEVDATADVTGSNAHFEIFWHTGDDCRSHDWAGRNVFCNLPFSIMFSIFVHFIKCKLASPLGTTATFVVPAWIENPAISMILDMPDWFKRVREYPVGTKLFTSPRAHAHGGGRRDCGPTRWKVWVIRCPPTFLSLDSVPLWVQAHLL